MTVTKTAPPEVAGARARLVDTLPGFLRQLAREPRPEAAASLIAEELVGALGALTAVVYFTDRGGRTLRVAASKNLPAVSRERGVVDIASSPLPAARAARSRAFQLVGHTHAQSSRTRDPRALASTAATIAFALPLLAGERVLGVVTAQLATALEPTDAEALESLGVVVGAIFDRMRLEEDAQARYQWSRVIAHEVRQALNLMSLHGSAISRSTDGVAATSGARVIEGVNRVNRLTNDLVDASLVDITMVSLQLRRTDLEKLAKGLLGPHADPQTANVRVETRGEIPAIEVDPERIEQILVNLIGNAVKYGRKGSEIGVIIERLDDHVVMSVTNEGDDIPERERERIFDRHYRARRDQTDGWGFGLYLCRGLAEAHGGLIAVESGGGRTTFSVVLPLANGRA